MNKKIELNHLFVISHFTAKCLMFPNAGVATQSGIVLQFYAVTDGNLIVLGLFRVADSQFLKQFSLSSVSKMEEGLFVRIGLGLMESYVKFIDQ